MPPKKKSAARSGLNWDKPAGAYIKGATMRLKLWELAEQTDDLVMQEDLKAAGYEITVRSIQRVIERRVKKRAEEAPLLELVPPDAGEGGDLTAHWTPPAVKEQFPGGVPDGQWHMYEEDPVVWCAEKKPRIESKAYGRIPFNPYEWQKMTMRYFWNGGSYFVEKSRQEGGSTSILVAGAHSLLYSVKVKGMPLKMPIVADKERTAMALLKIVKLALHSAELTDEERCRLVHADPKNKSDTVSYLVEEGEHQGESWIGSYTSTGSSARGEAFNAALLEEFAWAQNAEAIWNSVRPVVTDVPLARVWLMSTPNGASFHSDLCDNADKYGAHYLPLDWRIRPERDQAWRDQKDVELGRDLAAQECDLKRIGAGDNIIDHETVKAYASQSLWWGPTPLAGHRYCKGVDLSGAGQDKTVFTVIDITAIPAQLVFQQEYPHETTERRKKRIEEFDQRWPGNLYIDATNDASLVGMIRSRSKVAVRFRGEQEETSKVDQVEGLLWKHMPRQRMEENFKTLLETGSLVIHMEKFPQLRAALETQQYAQRRQADGKMEHSQKAKRRGKNPDHWDSGMLATIDVKLLARRARPGLQRNPQALRAGGPGEKLREMQRAETHSGARHRNWRGAKY